MEPSDAGLGTDRAQCQDRDRGRPDEHRQSEVGCQVRKEADGDAENAGRGGQDHRREEEIAVDGLADQVGDGVPRARRHLQRGHADRDPDGRDCTDCRHRRENCGNTPPVRDGNPDHRAEYIPDALPRAVFAEEAAEVPLSGDTCDRRRRCGRERRRRHTLSDTCQGEHHRCRMQHAET